jgi:hypothetical protein
MARNYKKEYANYQGTPEQIKKRASRNAARAKMVKAGKVRKGDGMDIDHSNGDPLDNSTSNLKVKPASKNRSFPRTKTAHKKK